MYKQPLIYSKIDKRNLDITVNQIISLPFSIKPNIRQKVRINFKVIFLNRS
jgi:hypothetical protein